MVCVKKASVLALTAGSAAVLITGCVMCTRGQLAEAHSLSPRYPEVARPSLSYAATFLPPDEQRNAELRQELVQQLNESGLFSDVRPQPAEAELTVSVDVVDVNLSTGRTLMTYLFTGGLWPVRVPYRYEMKAAARRGEGPVREYELTNEASCRVWSPGLLQALFGDLIDPRSPEVRRNLYRTLLWRMVEDGLLDPKEK